LAVVRRLQLPVVQVNIAEKQMNVVQGGSQQKASLQTRSNSLPPATDAQNTALEVVDETDE
jgi:hypothetical protein